MSSNLCVMCGAEIPEGMQVCYSCKRIYKRGSQGMNLDYIKAAEADIRNLPYLKKAISTLEKRRDFILHTSGENEGVAPDFNDPYIPEKRINDALNHALALAEISKSIVLVTNEIEQIEQTLQELPKEEREVLVMFFQKGMTANQIGEALYFESEKTVYKIRNRALYHYCLVYYGVSYVKK